MSGGELIAGPAISGEVTQQIELLSGGYAVLRDTKSVKAKHRKAVMRQVGVNEDGKVQLSAATGFDMTDGLIALLVEKFCAPYAPFTQDGQEMVLRAGITPVEIDDLDIPDYDTLADAVAPARDLLFPRPADPSGMGKPGSPTLPARG